MPFKAYTSIKAILVTLYRVLFSNKHLLEWTTSEEAEKQAKSSLISYYNMMKVNVILGILSIIVAIVNSNVLWIFLGIYMLITPYLMYFISKEEKDKEAINALNKEDKEYIKDIGKKTWDFFEEYLTEENNYLIPDNYQEDRKELVVPRTSSTNIGLSMLAVISAIDLGYIEKEKAIELLKNIILSVESLQKWNGHLYNWYNIKTKEPLIPRYISTVDSGNLVGYLYVVKSFLEECKNEEQEKNNSENNIKLRNKENIEENKITDIENLVNIINKLIEYTDFSALYNYEQQLFSIGFNIEENKLTDSYYDLLASEARQASLLAIAKKDYTFS